MAQLVDQILEAVSKVAQDLDQEVYVSTVPYPPATDLGPILCNSCCIRMTAEGELANKHTQVRDQLIKHDLLSTPYALRFKTVDHLNRVTAELDQLLGANTDDDGVTHMYERTSDTKKRTYPLVLIWVNQPASRGRFRSPKPTPAPVADAGPSVVTVSFDDTL